MSKPGQPQIDEDLQSRQMAVYGRENMLKLSAAKVLVSGINGLAAESAKNIILANVKSVTLHDTKNVSHSDLAANFYLSEKDIGKNRAETCKPHFQELNPSVEISVSKEQLTADYIKQFSVVILCDSSLKDACEINQICRSVSPQVHFIYGATHGVLGAVFCDFGDEFVCNDVTGEAVKTAIIEKIEKIAEGKQALVQCVLDDDIDFDDGEYVTFSEVKGMTELNNCKPQQIFDVSKGKKNFKIADTSKFSPYISGGIATEVKMLKIIKFRSLKDCLEDPGQLHDTDTSKQSSQAFEAGLEFLGKPEFEKKFGRSGLLLLALRAMDALGDAATQQDGPTKTVEIAKTINSALPVESKVEDLEDRLKIIQRISPGYGAIINPMAAIFGGIIGQEVIKACTGKFHPTHQWYLFDCEEILPETLPPPLTDEQKKSRYASQLQVLGKDVQDKLSKLNLFLVGAGALGCEFLKNFALMGISSQSGSTVTVTDDDVIEKSNLSRQFLFRNHNIGQSKSESAANASKVMNPEFKVKSLIERVQPTTENIFNTDFWDNLDIIVNALDNVKARLYVDSKCVFHGKPLLDSGTLGPKSHTQVVAPHKTENYGASRDPPEKEAPQCALHNFPHNIDHCLGLARSEFVGNFETTPQDAKDFTEKGGKAFVDDLLAANENPSAILDKLMGDPKFNCAMSGGVMDALVDEKPKNFEDCVAWARKKYQSYFVDRVKLLIFNCPEDMKTKTGTSFWAPPKRFPKIVTFDEKDAMTMKFIIAASNLRAKMFKIDEEKRDPEYFKRVLQSCKVVDFQPFKTEVKDSDADEDQQDSTTDSPDDSKKIEDATKKIQAAVDSSKADLFVNEFEKDQDLNFHIDFIQSFANLRARNYVIDEIDFLQAKLKAGRIIPAIATATALATGFVCLELLKIVEQKEAVHFRNTFSNLALPLFSQSEPAPAEQIKSGKRFDTAMQMDIEEVAHPDPQTIWDSITIQAKRDMTIQNLIDWFKKEKSFDLESWTFTGADQKADGTAFTDKQMKIVDYLRKRGIPCDSLKKVEIADSPPMKHHLELLNADGDDIKICRVILQFTD